MLFEPSSRCKGFVWKPDKTMRNRDFNRIIILCREYQKNDRMLKLDIDSSNPSLVYLQLINFLGKYDLYNIDPIVDFKKFTPRLIEQIKNKAFLEFWFDDIVDNIELNPDTETAQKSAALLRKIRPLHIDGVGVSKKKNIVGVRLDGKLYKITTNKKEWLDTGFPTVFIPTRQRGTRLYFAHLKENQSRTIELSFKDLLRPERIRYYSEHYFYKPSVQRKFANAVCDRIYCLPIDTNGNNIITLAEMEEYYDKYKYESPACGHGTRMFYFDEAELINQGFFPNGKDGFKVATKIDNQTIAIHESPDKFIRKKVVNCAPYDGIFVRAPRVFIFDRSMLEYLMNNGIIGFLDRPMVKAKCVSIQGDIYA